MDCFITRKSKPKEDLLPTCPSGVTPKKQTKLLNVESSDSSVVWPPQVSEEECYSATQNLGKIQEFFTVDIHQISTHEQEKEMVTESISQQEKRAEEEKDSATEPKAMSTFGGRKGKKYFNKFSSKWLDIPEFQEWLQKSTKKTGGHELAYCTVCDMCITAQKKDIHRHNLSKRHVRHLREMKESLNLKEMVTKSISQQQKRAEEEKDSATEPKAMSTFEGGEHKKYFRKFLSKWLDIPEYQGWLEKSTKKSGGHELAYCRVCYAHFTAYKSYIRKHNLSERHVLRLREMEGSLNHEETVTESVSQQQKRAEEEKDSATEPKAMSIFKPKNGKKYFRKFSSKWLKMPEFQGWLAKSGRKSGGHELAYCRVCDVDITAHRTDIHKHNLSKRHVRCLKFPLISSFNLEESILQQKRAEVNLAVFLAEQNLPLQTMDALVELLPNIFPDSEIAQSLTQHCTKNTVVIRNSLGVEFKKELLSTPGRYFSIVMYETTSMFSTKQCAFVVIYYDDQVDEIRTKFLDMKELKLSTADDLVRHLKDILNDNNVPLQNFVGFSSDMTNVMFGEHHSVVSLLKTELPDVVFTKCSSRLIHLVASEACMKLPRSVEDLLQNLGSHFSQNHHRQQNLVEFQEFFTVEIHKILNHSTTRWLSVKACVDRVLEQYTALNAYLRQTVFDDSSKTTEEMLNTMNNKFTEIYLEFMSYVLGLFTDFNTMFQSESPLLLKVKPEIQRLLKTLTSNYLKLHVVRTKDIFDVDHEDPNNFVAIKDIYLGIQAHESLSKLENDTEVSERELTLFFGTCQNFYIEAVSQIKKKFVFEEEIFSLLEIVDPVIAQSLQVRSLGKVFKRFSCLKENVNISKAEQEWREHALLEFETHGLDSSLPPEKYWQKVFSLKNAVGTPLFGELKKVIQLLMVLPFSNASVERIFSVLSNVKIVR